MDSKAFEWTGKLVFYSSIYGWLILLVLRIFIDRPFIDNLYHFFFDMAAYTFSMYLVAKCFFKMKRWINNKK